MATILNFPAISALTDNDLFLIWDVETSTTRKIKASAVKEYMSASVVATPTRIQAESYTTMSGIQTQDTSDTGGGLNVGWYDPGDWMEYSVVVPATGLYKFTFRIASTMDAVQLRLTQGNTTVVTVNSNSTGGWQSWTSIDVSNISLTGGTYTWRLTNSSSGSTNINWFEFVRT